MTDAPNRSHLAGATATETQFQTAIGAMYDFVSEMLGGAAAESGEISSGSYTPSSAIVVLDTEGSASSDYLDNILNTNIGEKFLLIHSTSGSRVIVVRHLQTGSGQFSLLGNASATLDDPEKAMLFRYDNSTSTWIEVFRNWTSTSIANIGTINEFASGAGVVVDGTSIKDGIISNTVVVVRSNTSDGSDNQYSIIAGGGGTTDSRGAVAEFYGNEHASTGQARISAGNVSNGHIRFYTGNTERLRVGYDGIVLADVFNELVTNAGVTIETILLKDGNVVKSGLNILTNTSDGSDNSYIIVGGGGAGANSRGGRIVLCGNEQANTGAVIIDAGAVSGGDIVFFTNNTERARISYSGAMTGFGNAVDIQKFTASGTWTKPASGTIAVVELVGAGGSGGRNSGSYCGGGGGGAGNRKIFPLSSLTSTVSVTIGSGGAARSSNLTGEAGGFSAFGSYMYAFGGGGGGAYGSGATSSGGGGGGVWGVGANCTSTTGGAGGGPSGGAGGNPAGMSISGGGGGGGTAYGAGTIGGSSVFGGGGGGCGGGSAGSQTFAAGGSSVFGGGGGAGNCTSGAAPGGDGVGKGGAGYAFNISGGAGEAPGGGGAACWGSGSSGAGARGECIVRVY